jgi:hypothetical protein
MSLNFKILTLVLILIKIVVLQAESENSKSDWDISNDRSSTSNEQNSIIAWEVPSKLINSFKIATSFVPIFKCLNMNKTYLSFNKIYFILISCSLALSSVILLIINLFVLRKMFNLIAIVELKKSVHLNKKQNEKKTIDTPIKKPDYVDNFQESLHTLNAPTSNELY